MKRGSKPQWIKQLALKRISRLFELAEQQAKGKPERAKRYVKLARLLSSRYNTPITRELKLKFCRKCGALWIQGKNVKVRANSRTRMIEYSCLECSTKRRVGYSSKHA